MTHRIAAYGNGSIWRVPSRSIALYVAIITPVASAKSTALSAAALRASADPLRAIAMIRHGRCRTRNPISSSATPIEPATPSRSPNTTIPMNTASSGAVPRANG